MLSRLLTGCSHSSPRLSQRSVNSTFVSRWALQWGLDTGWSGQCAPASGSLITSNCFHTDSLLESTVRSCVRIYWISQIAQSDGSHDKADQEHTYAQICGIASTKNNALKYFKTRQTSCIMKATKARTWNQWKAGKSASDFIYAKALLGQAGSRHLTKGLPPPGLPFLPQGGWRQWQKREVLANGTLQGASWVWYNEGIPDLGSV